MRGCCGSGTSTRADNHGSKFGPGFLCAAHPQHGQIVCRKNKQIIQKIWKLIIEVIQELVGDRRTDEQRYTKKYIYSKTWVNNVGQKLAQNAQKNEG